MSKTKRRRRGCMQNEQDQIKTIFGGAIFCFISIKEISRCMPMSSNITKCVSKLRLTVFYVFRYCNGLVRSCDVVARKEYMAR